MPLQCFLRIPVHTCIIIHSRYKHWLCKDSTKCSTLSAPNYSPVTISGASTSGSVHRRAPDVLMPYIDIPPSDTRYAQQRATPRSSKPPVSYYMLCNLFHHHCPHGLNNSRFVPAFLRQLPRLTVMRDTASGMTVVEESGLARRY